MSIVQSARPLSTSRSSLASRGQTGTRWNAAVSGERKEHILQSGPDLTGAPAQLIERSVSAHAAAREQHETVAHPLRVNELVNRQDQRAPGSRCLAQHLPHLAGLPPVEPIERLR